MKKALLVLLAVAVVAFTVDSSSAAGKIKFGIGADVAMPITSGFSDTQGIGIGGTAKGYMELSPMATLTATAGYMTFAGKDFSQGTVTIKAGTWNMIPVLVGARYYFAPASQSFRPYGAFDAGMIFGSYTVPSFPNPAAGFPGQPATIGGGSVTSSDFSYQPQIGFEAKQWDVALRYLGVSGAASIAARIGYMFN